MTLRRTHAAPTRWWRATSTTTLRRCSVCAWPRVLVRLGRQAGDTPCRSACRLGGKVHVLLRGAPRQCERGRRERASRASPRRSDGRAGLGREDEKEREGDGLKPRPNSHETRTKLAGLGAVLPPDGPHFDFGASLGWRLGHPCRAKGGPLPPRRHRGGDRRLYRRARLRRLMHMTHGSVGMQDISPPENAPQSSVLQHGRAC